MNAQGLLRLSDDRLVQVLRSILGCNEYDFTAQVITLLCMGSTCVRIRLIMTTPKYANLIWGSVSVDVLGTILAPLIGESNAINPAIQFFAHATRNPLINAAFANCHPHVTISAGVKSATLVVQTLQTTTDLNITLQQCKFDNRDINNLLASIGYLPKLRKLVIHTTTESHAIVCTAPLPPTIEYLDIQNQKADFLSIVSNDNITQWNKLHELHVSPVCLDDRQLASMPALKILNMENHNRCAYHTNTLVASIWEAAPLLEFLCLKCEFGYNKLSGFEGLGVAPCCATLRQVKISTRCMTQLGEHAFDGFDACPLLVDLEIECVNATTPDIRVISRIKKLTSLTIGTTVALDCIDMIPSVRKFAMIHNSININTPTFLKSPCCSNQLCELHNLQSDDIRRHLAPSTQDRLTEITLQCSNLDTESCAYRSLAELLVVCPHVRILNFRTCGHMQSEFPNIIRSAAPFADSVFFVRIEKWVSNEAFRTWPCVRLISRYEIGKQAVDEQLLKSDMLAMTYNETFIPIFS